MPAKKENKDFTVITVRVSLALKRAIDARMLDHPGSYQSLLESFLRDWSSGSAPPTSTSAQRVLRSADEQNLIKSLQTISSKASEVAKALGELTKSVEVAHGTGQGNLHDRATAAAKAGHGIADRLSGGPRGGGKTG